MLQLYLLSKVVKRWGEFGIPKYLRLLVSHFTFDNT